MNKKFKAILAVLVASLCVATISVAGVQAVNTDSYIKTEEGEVASSETEINHSMVLAGESVNSSDKVNGILFAAGSNVALKGTNEYSVSAGYTADIANTIEKDLFVAGGVVNVDKNAKVGRDAYIAGGVVNLSAEVKGNVFVAASSIKLSDVKVEGNLHIYADNITFDNNVTVNGTIAYNDNAQVTGSTTAKVETYKTAEGSENGGGVSYGTYAVSMLLSTIGLLIVSFVILAIFPGIYRKLSKLFKETKGGTMFKNVLLGICALIAAPIVGILLLLTMVGIPLAIILCGFYILCIYLSTAAAGVYFGHLILTKGFKAKANAYLELLIGVALISILALIPVIGWVISLLAILFGTGWVIALIVRHRNK